MVLLTRKCKRFLGKSPFGRKGEPGLKKEATLECKNSGHKVVYPLLNKDKFKNKKKTRCATWDDLDTKTEMR